MVLHCNMSSIRTLNILQSWSYTHQFSLIRFWIFSGDDLKPTAQAFSKLGLWMFTWTSLPLTHSSKNHERPDVTLTHLSLYKQNYSYYLKLSFRSTSTSSSTIKTPNYPKYCHTKKPSTSKALSVPQSWPNIHKPYSSRMAPFPSSRN